jgi:TonB family protein
MWESVILKRALPFIGALALGLIPTLLVSTLPEPETVEITNGIIYAPRTSMGSGASGGDHGNVGFRCSECLACRDGKKCTTDETTSVGVGTALQIISKPRPAYTDAARENNIQGTIRLRVMFLATGAIGAVQLVQGLPFGLTEQAVAAARQIRFEPKLVNGQPVTVTKIVEYSFTIY